jgi:hypothetical protein
VHESVPDPAPLVCRHDPERTQTEGRLAVDVPAAAQDMSHDLDALGGD